MRRFLVSMTVVLALSVAGLAHGAGELTPQRWVNIDIAVRQATLDSMDRHVALLSHAHRSADRWKLTDDNYRAVRGVYAKNGTNAGAHLAYSTKNQKQIDAWLKKNPDKQRTYRTLDARFKRLSSQIDTLRKGE